MDKVSYEDYLENFRQETKDNGPDDLRYALESGALNRANRERHRAAEQALREYDQIHRPEARREHWEQEDLTISREADNISRSIMRPAWFGAITGGLSLILWGITLYIEYTQR